MGRFSLTKRAVTLISSFPKPHNTKDKPIRRHDESIYFICGCIVSIFTCVRGINIQLARHGNWWLSTHSTNIRRCQRLCLQSVRLYHRHRHSFHEILLSARNKWFNHNCAVGWPHRQWHWRSICSRAMCGGTKRQLLQYGTITLVWTHYKDIWYILWIRAVIFLSHSHFYQIHVAHHVMSIMSCKSCHVPKGLTDLQWLIDWLMMHMDFDKMMDVEWNIAAAIHQYGIEYTLIYNFMFSSNERRQMTGLSHRNDDVKPLNCLRGLVDRVFMQMQWMIRCRCSGSAVEVLNSKRF